MKMGIKEHGIIRKNSKQEQILRLIGKSGWFSNTKINMSCTINCPLEPIKENK